MSEELKKLVDWILCQQDTTEPDISNLKLQKLLFYVYGCFAAFHNKYLFSDQFEAWEHGPVISSVYHAFKSNEKRPIPVPKVCPELGVSEDELDTLTQIMTIFGAKSAWALRELSHLEQPWIDAYNAGETIEPNTIKAWFREKYVNEA